MSKGKGWDAAEVTNNPQHLVQNAVNVRVNVHRSRTTTEILIHDLDRPRDERWTSIALNRRLGTTGVGRHSDPDEAWQIAISQEIHNAVETVLNK